MENHVRSVVCFRSRVTATTAAIASTMPHRCNADRSTFWTIDTASGMSADTIAESGATIVGRPFPIPPKRAIPVTAKAAPTRTPHLHTSLGNEPPSQGINATTTTACVAKATAELARKVLSRPANPPRKSEIPTTTAYTSARVTPIRIERRRSTVGSQHPWLIT